ncbi:MAG: hypothetical protein EOL88_07040 [Bacteroidia bacterium]|nr:hypothetical protein [Bacteroidales bacterium]MDD3011321.1 hypothetical protein [Bacteroidales bacterium]MDD3962155.1 hypothetical protein [Bacteroidales bacterium]MDY0286817.1 hypothetical protein [Bacteroidales bacterium]NCD41831.1 hypothetical protein [Bacteroidia bacterium]
MKVLKKNWWIALIVLVIVVGAGVYFNNKKKYDAYVEKTVTWMRKSESTMAMIEDKANKEGRTVEEQLYADARWYADQAKKEGKL